MITIINDPLLFHPFQSSALFHIETSDLIFSQIMPDFYMEFYMETPSGNYIWGEGPLSLSLSKAEGLMNIQHSMSMVLDTRFQIWFITRVYYKMRQILLQNATNFLLQNGTVITKCDVYYKLRQYNVFMTKIFIFYILAISL